MDEEQPVSRISRRKALKRIGAGAAIAWSAPVLSSLRTPAFAAGTPRCAEPCDARCGTFLDALCGATGPRGICVCSRDVSGKCFCWEDDLCASREDATAGCPAGQTAVSTCCDQSPGGTAIKCWDPCGTHPAPSSQGVTSGPRGSGA